MAARARSPRAGSGLSLRGGPVVPLVGVCVGVAALTAAVTLGGGNSSSTTDGSPDKGVVQAMSAADPISAPAVNTCFLRVAGKPLATSLADARTLTQIAAVGWQVKAPEEMVARVLDVAAGKPGKSPSVTEALDLFTREDSAVPTAASVAKLRALTEPGGLTCAFAAPVAAAESRGKSGLTPRADVMRQGIVDAFGKLAMSTFGPKAKDNPAGAAGRALSVTVPDTISPVASPASSPVATPEANAGWVVAHWLTARGADYKLDTIAYGDLIWAPTVGWRSPDPATTSSPARPGRLFVSVAAGSSAKDTKKSGSAKKSSKSKKS
ncbi:hypothetical protein [Sporichthya polymorpha]|uniref:hypothetical protein n=1 Tax=Sporichthya polymorpha TaxID=35751 RepID=UPI00037A9DE4|nr:hypothetical protein [Sporichthya polymorpha]